VKADIQAADLGSEDARQKLYDTLRQAGRRIDILVNNAGFGVFGNFLDTPWERVNQMLQLDMVALTHLTRLFVPDMVARRSGYVMQVSSIGAFQPSPTYAAYSAAKSYVLSFSEALNFELRGSGVSCTAVCPGVTATEFIQTAGQQATWYQKMTMMTSGKVARMGVRAMLARRYSIVTGWFNWMMAFSTRLTPRPVLAAVAYSAMKN
jgi:short-subunit dehydrogenase